jgi:hypothetical protein
MRKILLVLSFMIIWLTVSIVALMWGFEYHWPDFVHVDYGVPLKWATNTLSTFAGSANTWEVSISNLLADLIFWLGIMTAAVAVLICKLKP